MDSSDEAASNSPVSASLYRLLRNDYGDKLPVAQLTKAALVEISHALEDTVLSNQQPAMVFTGFQQSSHWLEEIKRYRELAGTVHSVCVFSGPASQEFLNQKEDLSIQQEAELAHSNLVQVTLAKDELLRQEWFLIILTHGYSVLLCGLDRLEAVEREADRVFDTVITFEPEIISHSLDLLEGVLANYRQDKLEQVRQGRQVFPPVNPSPRYVSLLIGQFMGRAGLYRPIMRRLDQEQAMHATINRLLHDASQPLTTLLTLLDLSKQLGEVMPEDLDSMIEVCDILQQLLNEMRNTSRYKTSQYAGTEYLEIDRFGS